MDNYNDLWQSVLEYCKERITSTAYNLWLSQIEITGFDMGKATLLFSNEFKKSTVINQYGKLLSEGFENICGFPVEIVYVCASDFSSNEEKKSFSDMENFKNDILTFDNFIVGPSNKFAYAAAKAIASDPGGQINKSNNLTNYNPLFIYGNSGLGKTHILNAINYEIKKNFPDMKVLYVKAEEFTNEFISCLGKHTIDEFHEKYRNNIDVFLVDDIQFIAGRTSTEEEFFHTFNALVDNGKQVVLTSDRPPKEIHTLAVRLCSRFESGLLADIQTPEFETRCAIIKRKAELLNFSIPDNVVNYIAERIKTNIRQLEGTTNRLHAKCHYSNQVPSISLAQTIIKDIIHDVQPLPITINRIIEEVSRTTGVSVEDIQSKKRTSNISNARKMCIYIVREITGMSYEQIGKEFNDMDHSSVIYNIQKMEKLLKTDSSLNSKVLDIINNIKDAN